MIGGRRGGGRGGGMGGVISFMVVESRGRSCILCISKVLLFV